MNAHINSFTLLSRNPQLLLFANVLELNEKKDKQTRKNIIYW